MPKKISKNVQIVLDILSDEVRGDVVSALKKMHPKYSMTWVYKSPKGKLFPKFSRPSAKNMQEDYAIKDRHYDIHNITEGKNLVMVELVENYTDSKTHKKYRTPLVLVLEFKGGKIIKGRHYCDPNLSFLYLSKKQVNKIFA